MGIFFWILSGLFWLLSIYYLWLKNYPRFRYPNLPPGPSHKPFFGEVLNLKPRLFMAFDKIGKKYGEISFFYLFFKPIILLNSYRAIKEAYNKPELSGRLNSKIILETSHNSGILFMDGEVWKTHRRLTLKILRDFGVGKSLIEESVQREAEDLCDYLKLKTNEFINTNSLFSTTAANIILKVVFGVRPGYFNEAREYTELMEELKKPTQGVSFVSQFVFPFESLQQLVVKLKIIPQMSEILKSIHFTHNFVQDKIQKHRETFVKEDEPSDFIYAYLQEQVKNCSGSQVNFDDWKIIRNVFELFLAGTDTTSAQITWLILLLSQHDDIRQKAFNEIQQECGTERIVSMEDKKKLHFTQALIDEVMRFSVLTPTGAIPHRALEETQLLGYTIPKDSLLFANFCGIFRDPQIWKYPNEFNPENFLDANGHYLSNENLIPFSIGKRVCIGEGLARMELFIFVVSLLQKYRFELQPIETKKALDDILLGTDGTIKAPGKHLMKFIPL